MKLADLDPKTRAEVDAALKGGTAKAARKKDRSTVTSPGLPLTCCAEGCGFVAFPATEGRLAAHQAAATGHGRFQWTPEVA